MPRCPSFSRTPTLLTTHLPPSPHPTPPTSPIELSPLLPHPAIILTPPHTLPHNSTLLLRAHDPRSKPSRNPFKALTSRRSSWSSAPTLLDLTVEIDNVLNAFGKFPLEEMRREGGRERRAVEVLGRGVAWEEMELVFLGEDGREGEGEETIDWGDRGREERKLSLRGLRDRVRRRRVGFRV
ncbi:hypothetical protein EJ04DRAFT_521991 [Polyplosphaeria fusca]|uniref:Uncharacterized protein n=1 Tax=Polyplosphaeria fusca TaxID=682080 RepID=A0A9P4R4N3_9PLEO|nr:hypothetical protein EJ04DRAFT_521991 [Polyplosphaeria fusca]